MTIDDDFEIEFYDEDPESVEEEDNAQTNDSTTDEEEAIDDESDEDWEQEGVTENENKGTVSFLRNNSC